jgi:hypothetical protein
MIDARRHASDQMAPNRSGLSLEFKGMVAIVEAFPGYLRYPLTIDQRKFWLYA